ncbi:MAG: hypothetical protein LBQ15_07205 [Clostridium sp.]|jgi:hypothetical protein|nr:hypothetical protein [Clostridium sp.]
MSGTKNTTPEAFDETTVTADETAPMTQEEILLNESELLAGLLELGKSKDDAANYKKIQIKRDGVLKLEFRVRPISEDENQKCWRQATSYAHRKPNQPKVAIDTDLAMYRAYIVYTATIDEDRAKLWDNRKAQEALGVLHGVDMIDRVLLAGEKNRVYDLIDEISGGGEEETEEYAKN